jgi:hypothetical protein
MHGEVKRIVGTTRTSLIAACQHLQQDGIVILANAVDHTTIVNELGQQAALYEQMQRKFFERWAPDYIDDELGAAGCKVHPEIIIDRSSVMKVGASRDSALGRSCHGILRDVTNILMSHCQLARPVEKRFRFDDFTNFYIQSSSNIFVKEHVDSSVITCVTAAADLLKIGTGPIEGFQYIQDKGNVFVDLIPPNLTDIILMCGRDCSKAFDRESEFPAIRHRVIDPPGIKGKRRFTFIFRVVDNPN